MAIRALIRAGVKSMLTGLTTEAGRTFATLTECEPGLNPQPRFDQADCYFTLNEHTMGRDDADGLSLRDWWLDIYVLIYAPTNDMLSLAELEDDYGDAIDAALLQHGRAGVALATGVEIAMSHDFTYIADFAEGVQTGTVYRRLHWRARLQELEVYTIVDP